jgi:hypothetical protein
LEVFEPKPHELTLAEKRWGRRGEPDEDKLGMVRGVRYYIYGAGVLGLLIVAEDYISGRFRKKTTMNLLPEPPALSGRGSANRRARK